MREPVGQGVEEVAGGGGDGLLRALGGGVDAEATGEWESLDPGDKLRDAGGLVGDELAEITGDGRQGDPEEEHKSEGDDGDEQDNGDAAAGRPGADTDLLKALDDWHEHDGEQGADVEDFELFHQVPGEGERKDDGEDEEDVSVHLLARFWRLYSGDGALGRRSGLHHVVCRMHAGSKVRAACGRFLQRAESRRRMAGTAASGVRAEVSRVWPASRR